MPSPVTLSSFLFSPLMSSPGTLSFFLPLSAAPLSVVPVDGPLAVLLSFFSPQPASEKSSSAVTKSMARVCFIAAFLLTFISRDTQAIVCARSNKKPDVNFVKTHVTDTNSAKSLAKFRAYRREIIIIIFLTTCASEKYFSPASVEIDRLRRLIYARSGCKKQKKRTPYGVLFF